MASFDEFLAGPRPGAGGATPDFDSFLNGPRPGERGPGPGTPEAEARDTNSLNALVGGLAKGLSFGHDDEIAGFLQSLPALVKPGQSFWSEYEKNRDNMRRFDDALAKEHPLAVNAGDIGSALVPGGLAAKGLAGATGAARAAGLIGTGAAAGALRAEGDNRDPGALLGDMARGAAIGGAAGGVGAGVSAIGRGAQGVGREINDFLGKKAPLDRFDEFSDRLGSINPEWADQLQAMYRANPALVENLMKLGPAGLGGRHPFSLGRMATGAAGDAADLAGRAVEKAGDSLGPRFSTAAGEMAGRGSATTSYGIEHYLSNPQDLQRKVTGSKFEPILADAIKEGPEAFHARMYVLLMRPEFRKLLEN
ncbi:hypothetical protein [Azospirillum sp. sgz301742]